MFVRLCARPPGAWIYFPGLSLKLLAPRAGLVPTKSCITNAIEVARREPRSGTSNHDQSVGENFLVNLTGPVWQRLLPAAQRIVRARAMHRCAQALWATIEQPEDSTGDGSRDDGDDADSAPPPFRLTPPLWFRVAEGQPNASQC